MDHVHPIFQDILDSCQRRDDIEAKDGPGDMQIVHALAEHYDVPPATVVSWLTKFDAPTCWLQLAHQRNQR